MSATLHTTQDNFVEIAVTGLLSKAEIDLLPIDSLVTATGAPPNRLLITLSNFEGWAPNDDWSDLLFAASHGKSLERIAILGDPVWETEALLFMGAGVRKTLIQFFTSPEVAHKWLLAD